jgi:hypothetical protein
MRKEYAVSARLSAGDSAQAQPATLAEAHDVLSRQRPAKDADPLVWVKFHRHCATVYERVSKVDPRHRYEAVQCAGLEIRKARDIEHQLNPEDDDT